MYSFVFFFLLELIDDCKQREKKNSWRWKSIEFSCFLDIVESSCSTNNRLALVKPFCRNSIGYKNTIFFFFLHYYPDSSRSSNILCIISRLSCLIDRGNTLCTEFEGFPVSSDMLLRLMSLIITNIFTTKSSIYQNVAKSTKITFFFFQFFIHQLFC